MSKPIQQKIWGHRTCLALTLALSLGALTGCDELLEVDLPAQLGDDAIEDPAGATTLVNSVIGQFEKGWNWKVARSFGLEAGCEELLRSPGVYDFCAYDVTVDNDLFNPLSISRSFAYQLHDKLGEWTVGQVPLRARYLPISSIYAGATLEVMAEHLCEVTIDAGELMTPMQAYTEAEKWLTQAITEIQAVPGGDFAMPFGASSAKALAYGLRARVRWAMRNSAGALSDAAQVPQGFVAWVTREPGTARMNLIANHTQVTGFVELYGMVDWWVGPNNPVTGRAWPKPIPFTGYHYLGILPNGRAVTDAGYSIRVADNDGGRRFPDPHPGREATAVADPRVTHTWGILQGSGQQRLFQAKWKSENDDLPWVSWKEMQLIAAEVEGGQRAIDRVNVVRAAGGLPRVTYADPSNAQQIKYMIIEERRREFFVEGRYFPTMLQNTDILWFPRAAGSALEVGDAYGGAVKWLMPESEYLLNPNLSQADRGTGCAADVRPVNFS
jgi:hypothetical protein